MRQTRIVAALFALLLAPMPFPGAQCFAQRPIRALLDSPFSPETRVVNDSTVVLRELAAHSLTPIPSQLLQEASGIAIIPGYVRGAFVVGVAGGRGLLLMRDANQQWQAPEFITLTGGSVGWQAGIQATDLVLVLRTPRSLANIRRGKLTLGADASAAAGPVGRYAGAATDAALQAEILTYSRSRGLFAGVSLNGAVLQMDLESTQRYYRPNGAAPAQIPPSAQTLLQELNRWSSAATTQQPADPYATSYPQADPNLAANPLAGQQESLVRLEQAVHELQNKVNPRWAEYLALPESRPGSGVALEDWQAMWTRYERVQAGAEYEALRVQPEFQTALRILRSMATAAGEPELMLPPPPSASSRP